MIRKIKWNFISSVVTSILLISVIALRWQLVDLLTVFLVTPFIGIFWILFIISSIFSVLCLKKKKEIGNIVRIPIAIHAITLGLIVFVPFTTIWLYSNFWFYKNERKEVVQNVQNGLYKKYELLNNSYLIPLGKKYPVLSMGGNEVLVENIENKKYIFFYTFRGVLDNYAGFIYVPNRGNPKYFADFNEESSTYIHAMDKNWYYVSHH